MTIKRSAVLGALLVAGCSAQNHSFVVDTAEADKPITKAVVTICKEAPKTLQRSGRWFVGRVVVGCEGAGKVQLTHRDGTTTDCPIGYLTNFDDWWLVEVRGRSCTVKWKSER